MISVLRPPSGAWPAGLALAALLAVGFIGAYRYVENYWLYRGFAPPSDAAFVNVHGTTARFYVASPALGGRRQPVDVYLPPGYAAHPAPPLPGPLPPARRSRAGPARSSRPSGWASSRTSSSRCTARGR